MDADWLRSRLESGHSIESIAREAGKHPSTVGYWANKHGLTSHHAARHAARGPLERETLRELVEQGLSIRQIAERMDRSAATVRHWLRRHGLRTEPARYARRDGPKPERLLRECPLHGWTGFVRTGTVGTYRCGECNSAAVVDRRREIKAQLVAEAGGRCAICGFDAYLGALQFHHRDPAEKAFSLSCQGVTRSLSSARAEARKCVLLCANCHAMVEAGLLLVPLVADTLTSASTEAPGPG
jgi:transposase-like protein